MESCVTCGTVINPANRQEVFYTVKPSVYECGKCHNADINQDFEADDKKPINAVEALVILVTVATIIAIVYLIYIPR